MDLIEVVIYGGLLLTILVMYTMIWAAVLDSRN